MSEEVWYKMLAVSVALHIVVIGAFSIPIKFSSKRIDLSGSYSVNLVGSAGNLGGGGGGGPKVQARAKPEPKPKPDKPAPAIKEKKVPRKPQSMQKEDDAVSLSKKKSPKTTREEVDRLEERIRSIRKKTDYIDIAKAGSGGPGRGSGGGGLPGSGGGGGAPLDPAMQKYLLDIWEKIKNAWNVPGMVQKKDLETVVMVKIRKDGRIVDINVEKRSGNRVYDESVLRVLRAVEPLPPIPSSLNTDALEIGFRFLPGGVS
ncbi:MAG: energy transducer TonB [Syntrophorhabdaceae bacterium]|nr:TonB C-terminal domain-containing protein [Syntrophorhabdaceae bacterium]MDD4195689.1 energy transducer TonB [Syntrophorhabdaceae bacterium]HOC45346.1 energy transducer TonB [Syntrophorhabdaceae bacterium]